MSGGCSCGRNSALSLSAPCWDGAGGEATKGMAVPHGRHGSWRTLTQALVRAEAASDFHRKDGKRNKHCSRKKTVAPSVPERKGSGHLAPVWHVPVTVVSWHKLG